MELSHTIHSVCNAFSNTKFVALLLSQVFVTATARCLDIATALVLENSVMLLTSPSTKQQLLQRLNSVIFPADDVTVMDVSDKCRMLTVMGPQADDVLKQLAKVSVGDSPQ